MTPLKSKLSCTRQEFESLVNTHMRSVVDILAKGTDSLIPAMAVLALQPPQWKEKKLTLVMITGDFNEHDDKYTAMRNIGIKFFETQQIPLAVVMASEAWCVIDDHIIDSDNIKNLQPRDDPRRKEVVNIQGIGLTDIGNLAVLTHMDIGRDDNDNIIPGEFATLIYSDDGSRIKTNLIDEFFRGFTREMMGVRNVVFSRR